MENPAINPEPGTPTASILPRPLRPGAVITGIALILAALLEVQFAAPSFNLVYQTLRGPLSFLDQLLAAANQFVGELTIAVIVIIIWTYNHSARHTIAPYLLALLIASTIGTSVKVITGRARPSYGLRMDENQIAEVAAYLANHANPILKPQRGDYWTWLTPNRPGLEFLDVLAGRKTPSDHRLSSGDYSSFPSGHATSAFLLAAYLSILYPRSRLLWYIIAVGTALYRVRARRHYPGDVLAGAGLGYLTAHILFSMQWTAGLGRAVENRITRLLRKTSV